MPASALVPVEQVRAMVLAAVSRLGAAELAPADALGRVLAREVVAAEEVPPFSSSSMDGYALRSADVAVAPARLEVVGNLMAGDDPAGVVVGPGQAVRIMTGAVLPEGADAVCMVELTRNDGAAGVVVDEAVPPGSNVRLPGGDIALGSQVFAPGTVLGAAHVGVLASLGVPQVLVFAAPRVGVLSTGDELVHIPGPLAPGKIRDSNRPALLAQLGADGFVPVDLGWVADDPHSLVVALEAASRDCDAVLTSGGVSVGDKDVVKMVLSGLPGAEAKWLQVAVKPAKPFGFCLLPPGGTPLFGLPGNPVSAMVSYELFARPALRRMAGHPQLFRPVLRALADAALRRRPDGKLHLLRAVLTPAPGLGLRVAPLEGQGSHQLHSLASANCLVALPDGEGAEAGEAVDVWLLGELPGPGGAA